jgi:hypothetical protein
MGLFSKTYKPVIQDGEVVSETVTPKNNKAVTPVIVVKPQKRGWFSRDNVSQYHGITVGLTTRERVQNGQCTSSEAFNQQVQDNAVSDYQGRVGWGE